MSLVIKITYLVSYKSLLKHNIMKKVKCTMCSGTGAIHSPAKGMVTCPDCQGKGYNYL